MFHVYKMIIVAMFKKYFLLGSLKKIKNAYECNEYFSPEPPCDRMTRLLVLHKEMWKT